jgi:hypothetical protein
VTTASGVAPAGNWKYAILVGVIVAMVAVMFFIPPIPQSETYHHFADARSFGHIPSTLNVLSNAFFLVVGILGIRLALRDQRPPQSSLFIDPVERWPYFIFFLGVALTTFGSGYYHAHPDNARLVWDRLPMTIGFMSLLAATIDERISAKIGVLSLVPLLFLGGLSVLYWNFTEASGRGDLRPYALVQFGSLIVLLLLVALFPRRYTRGADLIISLGIYVLSKIFEAADRPIFGAGEIVSGHTLKHLTAAIYAYWIYRMLRLRDPIASSGPPTSYRNSRVISE